MDINKVAEGLKELGEEEFFEWIKEHRKELAEEFVENYPDEFNEYCLEEFRLYIKKV